MNINFFVPTMSHKIPLASGPTATVISTLRSGHSDKALSSHSALRNVRLTGDGTAPERPKGPHPEPLQPCCPEFPDLFGFP